MNPRFFLLLLLSAALLPACTRSGWDKALSANRLTLSYDDFGPESTVSKLLGPRGDQTMIIAHHGATRIKPSGAESVRYVHIPEAMIFLRNEVRSLPPTTANEALRQRLRATYARLYVLHRNHIDSLTAVAFSQPRGGMNRMLMLPASMPPSI